MSPVQEHETVRLEPQAMSRRLPAGTVSALSGLILAAVLLLSGWLFFGSMTALTAAISGHKLCAIEPYRRVEFTATDREVMVEFQLQNLRWNAVELSGAHTSCSCTVLPAMPLKIAPFQTITLPLKIHLGAEPAAQRLNVEFFVDGPNAQVPVTIDVVERDR